MKASVRHRNALLSHLPDEDFARLQPVLERVDLGLRQHLQPANSKIEFVYFLESGLASVVAIGGGERRQAELAVIGHEGMVGLPIVFRTDRSPQEIFMQVEGEGYCIPAEAFRQALDDSPSLLRTCLTFAHVFVVQAGYTALANARGTLEERLARWLLMGQDRIGSSELPLTHDFLALMLGVRRAGVTVAIQHFEMRGLIVTARGVITVLDRDGLEEAANGFYGGAEAEFERLFG